MKEAIPAMFFSIIFGIIGLLLVIFSTQIHKIGINNLKNNPILSILYKPFIKIVEVIYKPIGVKVMGIICIIISLFLAALFLKKII